MEKDEQPDATFGEKMAAFIETLPPEQLEGAVLSIVNTAIAEMDVETVRVAGDSLRGLLPPSGTPPYPLVYVLTLIDGNLALRDIQENKP